MFTGHIWRDIFKLAQVKLCMSTAFHPQTDGQSKAVNKTIAMYLRCITGDRPRSWLEWLPWAEYCYNTAYHSALKTTPFQVVYGRAPPALFPYEPASACTAVVDELLQDQDAFLADVHERLLQAQSYAKRYYDEHHRPLEFAVGDWVWLHMLHRPAQSLMPGRRNKLSPKYAGPFKVLERIGTVAYRLLLLTHARIHDVFHIGVLKPFHGPPPTTTPELPPLHDGRILDAPVRVLHAQLRRGTWFVLVKWTGLADSEATWEQLDEFKTRSLTFNSRTSCLSRQGVMLWSAKYMKAARDVAKSRHNQLILC